MPMNRREGLKMIASLTAVAAAPSLIGHDTALAQVQVPAAPAGPFVQPPLPFLEPQLAPTISNRTVTLHYGRHHSSYYANLNNMTKDTKFATMKLPELIIESNKEADRRIFNNAGQ